LSLEGAVIAPVGGVPHRIAVVWVHGLTGKFYGKTIVGIGRELARRGYRFVTGNNRGHDFGTVYRDANGNRLIRGGAWERFDEAPWILPPGSLRRRSVTSGSLCLVTARRARSPPIRPSVRTSGWLAIAPATDTGRPGGARSGSPGRSAGRRRSGQDLLPWESSPAGGGTWSAETYLNRVQTNLDVYGFHTPEPAIGRVRCPVLAFYGTDEAWVGGAADLETIRRNARSAARVQTAMIDGSDHVYTGCELAVAALIAGWVGDLMRRRGTPNCGRSGAPAPWLTGAGEAP
jgi:alpha-beta hydrolase superfamily lysophospholipase